VAPRTYRLGRRATSAAATRDAIVEAAKAVYLETGSAKAPLTAIAERADVSRGTILHHFGSADGLLDEVIASLLPTLELPDERILTGLHTTEARMRAYVAAMVDFFRRTTPWWNALKDEMGRASAQAGEAEYWTSLGRLQAAALGPELAADLQVQQAIGGVLHPGSMGSILWALEQTGMSAEAATQVVEDLVVGYLTIVERGKGGRGT
jgi:AcrR family transcriptional regulator